MTFTHQRFGYNSPTPRPIESTTFNTCDIMPNQRILAFLFSSLLQESVLLTHSFQNVILSDDGAGTSANTASYAAAILTGSTPAFPALPLTFDYLRV